MVRASDEPRAAARWLLERAGTEAASGLVVHQLLDQR